MVFYIKNIAMFYLEQVEIKVVLLLQMILKSKMTSFANAVVTETYWDTKVFCTNLK